MSVDILEDYDGPRTPEVLLARSVQFLEGQQELQNLKKQAERKAFLSQNPDLRLRLNLEPLRDIIDFSVFRCSPYSSIARDEAVKGSDIDEGVVVSNNRASLFQQLEFVRAIRSQGFEAYHQKEVDEVDKKNRAHLRKLRRQDIVGLDELPLELRQSMYRFGAIVNQRIEFYSQLQIKRMMSRGRLIKPLVIYLAGADLS